MGDAALILMAIEPLPSGDWLLKSQEALSSTGMFFERRRTELLAWKERRQYGKTSYAEGWAISRIWLAPGRTVLGITSRRVYFRNDGAEIDSRPEQMIVSGVRPPSPAASGQVESQWALVRVLKEGLRYPSAPVTLQKVEGNLGTARVVQIGPTTSISPPSKLNALYREHGFESYPTNFTVSVCPLESVSDAKAEEFARRLENVGRQRNVPIKVKTTNVNAIEHRLEALITAGIELAGGHCLLFVLPSKGKNPKTKTIELFGTLEENRVPFRRAYADDPLEYSIPDQMPSLLIAAGGRPHRSPTSVSGKSIWTVGVDLGHRQGDTVSILVLSLVDPDGGLSGAWAIEQPRDETVRIESISVLLAHCQKRLASFERKPHVMVLRDGRLFENEDSDLYNLALGADVSLFEYRKRGNPQMAWFDRSCSQVSEPIAAMVPGASTMFLITAPPRDDGTLSSVAKITWRPGWNGLGLKPPEIANILTASATAPGLGLQPRHLPAAIYWADGIAGANEEDLRFVGVPVVRMTSETPPVYVTGK